MLGCAFRLDMAERDREKVHGAALMHPTFLWQRGGGPEGEVAEEGTFAAGDETDAAFFVLKALVVSFEDVVVDAGEPAVAADFDGDAVPGLRVELDVDFL